MRRPIELLDEQCAAEERRHARDGGPRRLIQRVRIHPADLDLLREDLRRGGARPVEEYSRIFGVDLTHDESCVGGPVIDWRTPEDLQAMLATFERLTSR